MKTKYWNPGMKAVSLMRLMKDAPTGSHKNDRSIRLGTWWRMTKIHERART